MSRDRPNPWIAGLLAWLFPGAGHFYIGRRAKGTLFLVTLLGLFLAGLVVAEFHAVRLERHPIYYAAYVFLGLPTLLATFATSSLEVTRYMPRESLGTLYCATAALLNVLAILDVFGSRERGQDTRGAS